MDQTHPVTLSSLRPTELYMTSGGREGEREMAGAGHRHHTRLPSPKHLSKLKLRSLTCHIRGYHHHRVKTMRLLGFEKPFCGVLTQWRCYKLIAMSSHGNGDDINQMMMMTKNHPPPTKSVCCVTVTGVRLTCGLTLKLDLFHRFLLVVGYFMC